MVSVSYAHWKNAVVMWQRWTRYMQSATVRPVTYGSPVQRVPEYRSHTVIPAAAAVNLLPTAVVRVEWKPYRKIFIRTNTFLIGTTYCCSWRLHNIYEIVSCRKDDGLIFSSFYIVDLNNFCTYYRYYCFFFLI